MRGMVLLIAVLAYLVGASITFAVLRWVGQDKPELAFVVGAILGVQFAAVVHHRDAGADNSAGVKGMLGLTLALCTVLVGLVLHTVYGAFVHPEVTIGISAFGALVFPFVLFDTMWKALSKGSGDGRY